MRPTIKPGYPVTIRDSGNITTGIVCDASRYASDGALDVVHVDAAFKARRSTVIWQDDHFTWRDPSTPGRNAEDDPALESFVTTVKNGRY